MKGGQTTDDLELLLAVMPDRVRHAIEARPDRGSIIEIVLDLGRTPEIRFADRGEMVDRRPVEREDLDHVVGRTAGLRGTGSSEPRPFKP